MLCEVIFVQQIIEKNVARIKRVFSNHFSRRYPITAIRFKYAVEAGVSRSRACSRRNDLFFPRHSNSLIGPVSRTLMQYTLRKAVKPLINDTVG